MIGSRWVLVLGVLTHDSYLLLFDVPKGSSAYKKQLNARTSEVKGHRTPNNCRGLGIVSELDTEVTCILKVTYGGRRRVGIEETRFFCETVLKQKLLKGIWWVFVGTWVGVPLILSPKKGYREKGIRAHS